MAVDTPWSYNLHCMTLCVYQCLLNLLPRLLLMMHVHVSCTCTHVSSHACYSQSLVNMMVDATPLSGEGSSVYPISNIVPPFLPCFFACASRGEPGNEAVHMPMCIGTCTFPCSYERERERERERLCCTQYKYVHVQLLDYFLQMAGLKLKSPQ